MTTDLHTRGPGPELPGLPETLDLAADQEFDLGSVRAGIDGRVLVLRRRRRTLVAVAACVAAVAVVGTTSWLLAPGRDLGNVAAPTPPPTAAASPAPTVAVEPTTASSSESAGSAGSAVAYTIPDSAMLTAGQVGRDREITYDSADYANQPVVQGQFCDTTATGADGPAPVAGRQRSWSTGSSDFDGQVDIVVTGWASGSGPQAFADLAADEGRCRWSDPVTEAAAPGWSGDDIFLASTRPVFGNAKAMAVQRVGDLLVGVTAYDSGGDAAAQAEAVRVSELVVAELVASGLEATGR